YLDVAGPGAIVGDLVGAFAGVDLLLLAVALGFVLVILLVVYRSPILPIAVLSADLFALCGAALVVYQLAKANIITLNGQSQGIMSILVIGATTDYALLLVSRYREALTLHDRPRRAMETALRGAAPAIIASAATVIVGLLALLLSNLSSTKSLGPIAAIGIVSSLLVALSLLPAQLLIFGDRSRLLFWPSTPPAPGSEKTVEHRGWNRVARWVARHDRPVWIATAVVLAVFALAAPTLKAEGTSDAAVLRNASESTRGNAVLDEHFDAGAAQPINVVLQASQVDQLIEQTRQLQGVSAATPYRDAGLPGMQPNQPTAPVPGPEPQPGYTQPPAPGEAPIPDPSGPPPGVGGPPPGGEGPPPGTQGPPPGVGDGPGGEVVEIDGRVLVQISTEHLPDDPRSWQVVAEIRDIAHQLDTDALVGGSAAEKLDTRDTAKADLWRVVPVTLIGIFIMLLILLRSLVAPLLLVAANVLSFLATMGACALIFTHILDLPGADPSVPLYGFVFLVALGIDYTIFLLTRVREEAHELPTRDALTKALATTGGVITSAGLV
ncbi:MAG: MMPL family transporter, partial [Bowdeniella nasicola]|nr:MMPL family transporter [Bowdeniella nasicola]